VKSSIWNLLGIGLLVWTLVSPAPLLSQPVTPFTDFKSPTDSLPTELISEELPDAPLPQNSTQPPAASAAQNSSSSAPAQDSSQNPPGDKNGGKAVQRQEAEQQIKIQQKQRMVGVIPNFNAVLNGSTVPLTGGQKIRTAFRSAIDPYQFALAAFVGAIGQANDSHSSIDANGVRHGYEQGWTGYSKRVGSSYADQFNGTMIGNGILPAVLHQDPRYFRKGTGSIKGRIFYAAVAAVRCKSDKGKWQPNYSNVLGNLAAGGISNVYYPAADRGFVLTVEQALIVTAEGALGTMVIEFYPDVMQHVVKKKAQGPPPMIPSSTP
jgi:hypothetical protein